MRSPPMIQLRRHCDGEAALPPIAGMRECDQVVDVAQARGDYWPTHVAGELIACLPIIQSLNPGAQATPVQTGDLFPVRAEQKDAEQYFFANAVPTQRIQERARIAEAEAGLLAAQGCREVAHCRNRDAKDVRPRHQPRHLGLGRRISGVADRAANLYEKILFHHRARRSIGICVPAPVLIERGIKAYSYRLQASSCTRPVAWSR